MDQERLEERYTETSFANIVGLAWIFTQKHLKEFTMMAVTHIAVGVFNLITTLWGLLTLLLFTVPGGLVAIYLANQNQTNLAITLFSGFAFSAVFFSSIPSSAIAIVEASGFNELVYGKNFVGEGLSSKKALSGIMKILGAFWSCYFDIFDKLFWYICLGMNICLISTIIPNGIYSLLISLIALVWGLYNIMTKSLKYNFLPFAKLTGNFPDQKILKEHILSIPLITCFHSAIQCFVIGILAYQLPAMITGIATGPGALLSIFSSGLGALASIPGILVGLVLALILGPASTTFIGVMKALYYDIQSRHDFNPPGKVSTRAKSMYIVVILVVIAIYILSMVNKFTGPEFKERMKQIQLNAQKEAHQVEQRRKELAGQTNYNKQDWAQTDWSKVYGAD
ncbi:MAG: hypothetical protein OXU45_03880 [Candidatus Melainabacteria bacterium]|nr:hypothetical protein [Candidatus Melainabacteria bacterium]